MRGLLRRDARADVIGECIEVRVDRALQRGEAHVFRECGLVHVQRAIELDLDAVALPRGIGERGQQVAALYGSLICTR